MPDPRSSSQTHRAPSSIPQGDPHFENQTHCVNGAILPRTARNTPCTDEAEPCPPNVEPSISSDLPGVQSLDDAHCWPARTFLRWQKCLVRGSDASHALAHVTIRLLLLFFAARRIPHHQSLSRCEEKATKPVGQQIIADSVSWGSWLAWGHDAFGRHTAGTRRTCPPIVSRQAYAGLSCVRAASELGTPLTHTQTFRNQI